MIAVNCGRVAYCKTSSNAKECRICHMTVPKFTKFKPKIDGIRFLP